MQVADFVFEAITNVIDWDIPEEGYTDAVNARACNLAGIEQEDLWDYDMDITVH